ncbi:MAG: hypothetical protein AAF411_31345, partial [Myxococcota bacterium]
MHASPPLGRVWATLGALAALLLVPSLADAQSVALGDFRGSRANSVRNSLADRLESAGFEVADLDDTDDDDVEAVLEESGAGAAVTARVRRRGRRFRATATIYNGLGEEVQRINASARSTGALARRLASELEGPLRETSGGSSAAVEEDEPEAPSGGARRVAVASFRGSSGSRVRNQLIRALGGMEGVELVEIAELEAAAEAADADLSEADGLVSAAARVNVAALVEGSTRRRGRRFSASVTVRNAADGESVGNASFRGRSAATLARAARRQAAGRLEPLIAQTSAPAPV